MSVKDIKLGIDAIQAGKLDEGARLIRLGIKDEDIKPTTRATALAWLAETESDINEKIRLYRRAHQIDPDNDIIERRLNKYLSRQLPDNTPDENRVLSPSEWDAQDPAPNAPQQTPPPQQSRQQHTRASSTQQTPPPQRKQPTQQNPSQGWQQQNQQPQQQNWQQQPNQPPPQNPQGWQQQNQPPPNPQDWQSPQQVQQNWQQADPSPQWMNPPQTPQQIQLTGQQPTVGILDGPNGRGTGFFVTWDGLVATTRYVVGGASQVEVALADGRRIRGEVRRSFPQIDLALVQVPVSIATLPDSVQTPHLQDDTPLVVLVHGDERQHSAKRSTRHETQLHWFPTLVNYLNDAGGNPVYHGASGLLLGMMTKNLSRSNGYLYGLHIHRIYQSVQQYLQELKQLVGQGVYCSACGIISRAPNHNGYYCESCGNLHEYARGMTRYPQDHLMRFYGEAVDNPCPNCDSRAGFYDQQCLRCGYYLE